LEKRKYEHGGTDNIQRHQVEGRFANTPLRIFPSVLLRKQDNNEASVRNVVTGFA
jgi:hypothetical protein